MLEGGGLERISMSAGSMTLVSLLVVEVCERGFLGVAYEGVRRGRMA